MNPRRTIVILLGGPGAGKGTQAQEIRSRFGIPPISTGQILRNEIARQSALGIEAQAIINAGGLVSDDIVNRLVAERVRMKDCKHGFILDGYPRDIDQAVAFKGEIHAEDRLFVIDIDVDVEKVTERLTSRLNCQSCGALYNSITSPPRQAGQCDRCGSVLSRRADDREKVIRERFKAYRAILSRNAFRAA